MATFKRIVDRAKLAARTYQENTKATAPQRGHPGTVVDAVHGPVTAQRSASGMTVHGGAIPEAVLRFEEDRDVATISGSTVELVAPDGLRRKAKTAYAVAGGIRYELRPTETRASQLWRDGRLLAELSRPKRGDQLLVWVSAEPVHPAEVTLAHALVAVAGIGAPGVLGEIGDDPLWSV
jgi:hypothetical protein